MTITLELSPELEGELFSEATELGLPLSEYALRVLATRQATPVALKNGSELVAYWKKEGVVGARPDIKDSQEHARQIREQAQHERERRR